MSPGAGDTNHPFTAHLSLADGSVLAWVGPTRPSHAHYPLRRGMWVRIISYRVTDELCWLLGTSVLKKCRFNSHLKGNFEPCLIGPQFYTPYKH